LFRRDAGGLSAYLVDAETGELRPRLSDGQRRHDLSIAEDNTIGELLDVAASPAGLPRGLDPFEIGAELVQRYESLWAEVTREEVFSLDETYRIDERLQRLYELGYDVDELELVGGDDGYRLRLDPHGVE